MKYLASSPCLSVYLKAHILQLEKISEVPIKEEKTRNGLSL